MVPHRNADFIKQLPPHLAELYEQVMAEAPPFSTRKSFSELVEKKLGIKYEARSLERAPLPVQIVNGKATFPTTAGLELVFSKLAAAPVIQSGRRSSGQKAKA